MKEIQAEGTTYFYLTKKEGLPSSGTLDVAPMSIPNQMIWDAVLKTSMDDMRVILSSVLHPTALSILSSLG